MGLPPLASVSDVTVRLPSTMTVEIARTAALITDASAVVRSYSRQQFTLTQSTDRIRPIGSKIRLPQHPVVSVDSLALLMPGATEPTTFPGWYWDGSDEVSLFGQGQVINLAEELQGAMQEQTPTAWVTYTHGWAPHMIPADVVGVVCSMVIRTLTAPGLGGVISEGVGEYTYRLSDAAAQGPMTLTDAEREILKTYKPRRNSTAELRW